MVSKAGARRRILCIDDDEDTRYLMQAMLAEFGYEPVIAASVFDALEKEKAGGLALYMLDHWVTEGDGVELCRQIRALDSATPIMFYSAAGYKTEINAMMLIALEPFYLSNP